jgi:uncharacterized membrane protein YbhN (UPF0104 family)
MNLISNFFISIFESFGFYSSANGLGEHLKGLDVKCSDYTNQSIYNIIIICIFLISSLLIVNYYYGLFNRPNFTNRLTWILHVLISSLIIFVISFLYAYNDYSTGNYCKELSMTSNDCIGFGFATAIFSTLWCIIFSMIIKWKSNNNKKIPF